MVDDRRRLSPVALAKRSGEGEGGIVVSPQRRLMTHFIWQVGICSIQTGDFIFSPCCWLENKIELRYFGHKGRVERYELSE
jgi:hypothetical protein